MQPDPHAKIRPARHGDSAMDRIIYINGKYTAQRGTGVQRVASCLLQALDALLARRGNGGLRWILLHPAGSVAPALEQIELRAVGSTRWGLHFWEQLVLPAASRDGMLLSLSGSAPLLKLDQVCTFHDAAVFDHPEAYTYLFGTWYRFSFFRLAHRASQLITVSEFSRHRLAERLRISPDKMTVVPGAADHLAPILADQSILSRLGLEPQKFIVAVGSRNPTKNHRRLVNAFKRIWAAQDEIRLVIVGDSNDSVFAGDQHIDAQHIVDAGRVSDSELKALYETALGMALSSTYEGFGLPALEAMACGCPVLASSAAAIPEVCGDAALYFDPLSVDAIASAIQRLLHEEPLAAQLRQAGYKRARLFSWAASASRLHSRLTCETQQLTPA